MRTEQPTGDPNLSRADAAARASALVLDTIEVDLDLRSAPDQGSTSFVTQSTLVFEASAAETWVDFLGEAVDAVEVDGAEVAVDWDGARIRLAGLRPGRRTVRITARGHYSRSGEGLHRFVDPVDGAVYLYTQYEPADSRRVYPCFEQPDLKARWTFHVTAAADWRVLSGMPERHRELVEGGVRVSFHPTPPLSSYVTAIAAGPYHRVDGRWDGERQSVDLGVLCRASLASHLEAEQILDVTRRGLDFFTTAFAQDYPWGKYDQIFVPEYNLGAMENPGLVTFTEAYVFRGAATAAQREARANTILHEMAHMWFGDLVTMRWWDDLWLKESFADYMGSHAAAAVGGFPDAWVTFASRRKGWAYTQDQLPTTHPVVADIVDLEAAKLNFDGITYAKGASVLKQLVGYVGQDAFFRGAQRYFADHAFGNTTLEDLLSALERASGRDLRAWSAAWLETTGVPTVAVERDPLAIVQEPARPHRLTLGLLGWEGPQLVPRAEVAVDVASERTAVTAPTLPDADLIIANVDDRSYAKVRLDDRSTAAVSQGLSTIEDAVTRGVLWAALWNATRDGELAASRYLAIASTHAPVESNPALLADVLAHAAVALRHYVADAEASAARTRWLETAWRAMHDAAPGSDAQLSWARAVGAAAEIAPDRGEEMIGMLAGARPVPAGLALDPELRWSWLFALSAAGAVTAADLAAELERDATASGRTAYIAAMHARPDSDVRGDAWRAVWEDETLTNDHLDATIRGARAGGRRDLLAPLDADYYSRILPTWRSRSIEIAARAVRGLFPASSETRDADAWLDAHPDAPGALRRIVIEQRDHLARDLRVRAAQERLARS
ncbi:aminopeptidase N [Microbacterium sp. EYE_5]|uniref:aminopeptidase N n=1 Tax=unclassified Microbacterium TaxID=2609290 RepID=UPI002005B040|nr:MULTISPECIES: aminopeptidase N [unclassified Microbacterium]MCK6080679.1 aminopeptidase N [Microbacterium sp. EYE_382]MCK6085950.1 aminopeptidase N [Microbacterium sp. EYE_384]MCK6124552.1 aminopeptidase N [Microbacterium sp. EYE_80]MCK6127461.1 aminopeptidase N [Microbacterium sp. EYE_79]MCK6141634.1 aminopeptidase N [Microbacterium sp. EYE_39]